MILLLVAGISLIELHAPHGATLLINPAEVVSIREPHYGSQGWVAGSHCLVVMSHGNQIAVVEHCNEVRAKLEDTVK